MNILDQKEQVLKVELTKHGKKLLGLGYFQPKYFSFFDDSIIYDNSYAGHVSENINEIQTRILDKSLTFSNANLIDDKLHRELGNSDIINDYLPSWDMNIVNGKLSFLKNESTYYKNYFNFSNIQYDISLRPDRENVIIKEDYILIDLKELNVSDEINNFEIEIITFEELQNGNDRKLEKKLKFHQNKTNIVDGILYEQEELPYNFFNVDIDKDDVSYYLDVLVDDEIDTDFIGSYEKQLQERILGTYTPTEVPDPCEPCCDTPSTESC